MMTTISPYSLLALCLVVLPATAQEPSLVEAADWQNYWRVSRYDPAGMPCFDQPDSKEGAIVRYLYFKQPVYLLKKKKRWARVRCQDEQVCWFPTRRLEQMHSRPVLCPVNNPPMEPSELNELLDPNLLQDKKSVDVGRFYPTFYQIAREDLRPGQPGERLVKLKDGAGRTLAAVSSAFRRALNMQGTGMLKDGRVLNVARKVNGQRRYVALPDGSFGLGVAGFRISPYRSIALDFDLLCERLSGHASCQPDNVLPRGVRNRGISRKNKKKLVGTLLFLPAIKGASMPGGQIHDGFLCAVDVGGGIKFDRMDLFVGTDGGGNPYYPPCRRDNAYTRAGIESLIPSDWHHFVKKGDSYKRAVQTEYRQVSAHKGLQVFAYPGLKCGVTH